MEYGNAKYTSGKEKKITQIMISGKESEFGLVEDLLKKRGLESKNAQMVVGRLKSVVGTLFLVVLGISIIAVFVSGLVLIQYMQLLMSRNVCSKAVTRELRGRASTVLIHGSEFKSASSR